MEKIESSLFAVKKEALNRFCIAYPNLYKIAMSNLGYLSLCCTLNSRPLASCERALLPNQTETARLKKGGRLLTSLESGMTLKEFDLLAFSISFENDYINIVKMLELSGIPLNAKDRDETHPLLIAGGVATFLNPEPVADFFDAFLLGDSQPMVLEFVDKFCELNGTLPREELLRVLSEVKGVYVPSLYDIKYHDDGSVRELVPKPGVKPRVEVQISERLSDNPAYSYIISKDALFSDMFLVEISRGCGRMCRFCAAGYNYLPYKTLSADEVVDIVAKNAGGRKVGLVGAAVSDYREIDKLCDALCDMDHKFSVSSFRADSLSDALLTGLKKSGHKTLTIAPEAGSQRMRDIINKGVSETDILNAAERIAAAGILNVKLYYIIGLPFESESDIDAIISLTKKVRDVFLEASKKLKRAGSVSVSVSPFVPKPNTPFFYKGMESERELKRRVRRVSEKLRKEANITMEKISVKDAVLEAVFARGDRRLADLIRLMAGGKSLKQAARELELDLSFYAHRDIPLDETPPFGLIVPHVKKSLLVREFKKAKELALD